MQTTQIEPDIDTWDASANGPTRPTDANGNFLYRVPERNLDALLARIEKLNKRARRLNMPPIAVTQLGDEFVTLKRRVTDEWTGETHTEERTIRLISLTVIGETPRIDGWEFAATIQHEDGANLLHTRPQFETALPLQYRHAETYCEHCAKERRRNDTYILFRAETAEWKQVGRSCLGDFLRTTNPQALAEWAEVMVTLASDCAMYEDESFDSGDNAGRNTPYFEVARLLAQVRSIVRQDGWCSRNEARNSIVPKMATADYALYWFDLKWVLQQSAQTTEKYAPTEEDFTEARAAIDWAQTLPEDVSNDYLWNIRVIAHKEYVDARAAGLAGSIMAAYNRHLERELARKYQAAHPSEYFGTPKVRETFRLTIVGIQELEGTYGLTTLIRFKQEGTNNTAIWFASGSPSFKAELDTTYTLTATVKQHEPYREHKQTILTRVAPYVEKVKKPRTRKPPKATAPEAVTAPATEEVCAF